MSTLTLNFQYIYTSIQKAEKTASYLGDYIEDMQEISKNCSDVTGSDPYGYLDSAERLVKKKIERARKEKNAYTNFAKQLQDFGDFASEKDTSVEKNIDITVSEFIGKRSWGQQIGDWIYARYVDFLDHISCISVVGEYVAQALRSAGNWITNSATVVSNWFKYGDGKYIWNIAKSVAGMGVAIAGLALSALGVITAAPALLGVAVVGVVASSVVVTLQFGDMMTTVESNTKALDLSAQYKRNEKEDENWWQTENNGGSLTAARYYGSISGVKDWINKTDFGGETANNFWEDIGFGYDGLKHTMQTISSICQLTLGLGNAQYLKDTNGNWARYSSGEVMKKNGNFFNNLRVTYLEKVGYKFERTAAFNKYATTNGYATIIDKDYSKAFKFKFFEGYAKKFGGTGVDVSKFSLHFFNGSKLIKNLDGFASNVETFSAFMSGESGVNGAIPALNAGIDLAQNWTFFDAFTKDTTDAISIFDDIIGSIEGIFSTSENAYKAYLNSTASNN